MKSLAAARLTVFLSLLVAIVGFRSQLAQFGEAVISGPLTNALGSELLGTAAQSLSALLRSLAVAVTGVPAESLRPWVLALLAIVSLAGLAMLWYALTLWFWKQSDRFAGDAFFARTSPSKSGTGSQQWMSMVYLAAAIPVVFAVAAVFYRDAGRALGAVWRVFQLTLNIGCVVVILSIALTTLFAFGGLVVIAARFHLLSQRQLSFQELRRVVWRSAVEGLRETFGRKKA